MPKTAPVHRSQDSSHLKEGSAFAAGGPATGDFGAGERLVHDAPDRARAAPALRAAAEAVIDLARGPRRRFIVRQRRTNVVVGKYVTGTDNHRLASPAAMVRSETIPIPGRISL